MALIDFTTIFYIVIGIAVLHTLAGPDHYLTFWSLAKSHKWSKRRTLLFTTICGLGHVTASLLMALPAIYFGKKILVALDFQDLRVELAAWALIFIGLFYIFRAFKQKALPNSLFLVGSPLFIAFILGPCEPIIALLMAEEAIETSKVVSLIIFYTLGTIITMVCCILSLIIIDRNMINFNTNLFASAGRLKNVIIVHHASHLLPGVVICGCGLAMLLLGV